MKLHCIIENGMDLPEDITICHDFGTTGVVFRDKLEVIGTHCFVEGERSALISFFSQFPYIWVGNGSPDTEQFYRARVSSDKTVFEVVPDNIPSKNEYLV